MKIATRKLGKEVMLFVNSIAEIVHSQVHRWDGSCNKNLGNGFVIVWRIADEETLLAANAASILSRNTNARHATGSCINGIHASSSNISSSNIYDSSPGNALISNSPITASSQHKYNSSGTGNIYIEDDDDDEAKSVVSDWSRSNLPLLPAQSQQKIDLRRVPGKLRKY
jgi:hypothetical protein